MELRRRDEKIGAAVELDDGSILTAYYQKPEGLAADKCAFPWSRWRLPA